MCHMPPKKKKEKILTFLKKGGLKGSKNENFEKKFRFEIDLKNTNKTCGNEDFL